VTDPIIIARNLSHTYQAGDPMRKPALVDVSLEIARGSCAGIIGVTGSGKSTLVQHLNGLLRPTAGALIVDGVDVGAKDADLAALRRRVGMLFQFAESQLFAPTVFADVAFGPQRLKLSRREVRARVLEALDMVGLPPRQYGWRSPFHLSGGQMRRVALAGILAMAPDVLILDEPTTGLDADARHEFYHYLEHVREERGVTVVLVSHDMAEVAALADHLFVLHEGRLVLQGTPRALFAQAERLREWGLAAPPLSELLALLRRRGVPVPPDVLTLDEAVAALRGTPSHPHMERVR
jgi:energy-coupling factor transport system ATP-binding protein